MPGLHDHQLALRPRLRKLPRRHHRTRDVEEPAVIWGGLFDEQFDPCYHIACDTLGNHDRRALEVNSDAIAFAQLTYAFSTESVNGVDGERVPGKRVNLPAPAGPEGTFATTDGGHGPHRPTA